MPFWKKLLLRSLGIGAGFAVTLSAIVAGWAWYTGRPQPPRPWDRQAIVAEYVNALPEGDKNNLSFHYVLQNNTGLDYRVDSSARIEITGRLKAEKSFSRFSDNFVTTDYPIFLPAKARVRIASTFHIPTPSKKRRTAPLMSAPSITNRSLNTLWKKWEIWMEAGPLLRFFARVGTSTVCRGGSDFVKPKHPISAASIPTRRKSRRVGHPIHYYFEEIKSKGVPAGPSESQG
jgi:hypothetical protein